jgi:hypothetical protein
MRLEARRCRRLNFPKSSLAGKGRIETKKAKRAKECKKARTFAFFALFGFFASFCIPVKGLLLKIYPGVRFVTHIVSDV